MVFFWEAGGSPPLRFEAIRPALFSARSLFFSVAFSLFDHARHPLPSPIPLFSPPKFHVHEKRLYRGRRHEQRFKDDR